MLPLLKWIGGPGALDFLILCCVVSLVLWRSGARRLARRSLGVVLAVYLVASLPWVATAVAAWLSPYQPAADPAAFDAADALIVLHGDNVLGRLREARRIADRIRPRHVLASGSRRFVEMVAEAGIPAQAISADEHAANTREQIDRVALFVADRGCTLPVIVASRLQMPRVEGLLRARGLTALLAPSPIDDEPPVQGVAVMVPAYIALRVTRDATYEAIALRYYRSRGWIG